MCGIFFALIATPLSLVLKSTLQQNRRHFLPRLHSCQESVVKTSEFNNHRTDGATWWVTLIWQKKIALWLDDSDLISTLFYLRSLRPTHFCQMLLDFPQKRTAKNSPNLFFEFFLTGHKSLFDQFIAFQNLCFGEYNVRTWGDFVSTINSGCIVSPGPPPPPVT